MTIKLGFYSLIHYLGVMLTHRQLNESLLNMMRMQEEMKISLVNTAYAAYLPMAHLYGYLLNLGNNFIILLIFINMI